MSVLKDSMAIVRDAEKLVIGRSFESSGRLLTELLDAENGVRKTVSETLLTPA